jgi:cadmium resistance protein CadD (predicted permease)
LETILGLAEKLEKEANMVKRVAFTFLGGAIILMFARQMVSIFQILAGLIGPFVPYYALVPIVLALFGLAVFILLVLYSALVSQLLNSFVSPIDIAVVSIALFIIQQSQAPQDSTFFPFLFLGSLLLFLLGLLTEPTTKWIVGRAEEGRHQVTFEINASLESVKRVLDSEVLKEPLELAKKKPLEQGKLLLYQSYYDDFYVFLAEKPEDSKSSLMHLEGYCYTRYAIEANSKKSIGLFRMRAGYIESVLQSPPIQLKNTIIAKRISDDSFPFIREASRVALAPATSRLQGLPRLRWPRQTLGIIIGLTFLVFAAYTYSQSGAFSPSERLSTILGLISIVVGIMPHIKGPKKEAYSEGQ